MTLLRQIQDAAVGTEVPVSVLLRQCLVLASRLDHEPLRDWARQELDGYPDDADLPSYRPTVGTTVRGNFSGPLGSSMSKVALAQSVVPEEWRERLFTAEVRERVAQLEEYARGGDATLSLAWPMDVVAGLQDKFMEGMNLMGAWQEIPASVYAATLSGIRDRVLQFVLEIEKLDPDAGEAAPGEAPIEPARVNQIFNQTFYGDHTAVAAGNAVHQTQTVNVTTLAETLRAFGVPEHEQRELLDAVEEEGVLRGDPPGDRTRGWVDRLESGAVTVGTGVATQTAVQALSALLGL